MGRWGVRNKIWGLAAGTSLALGAACAVGIWGPGVAAAAALGFFVPGFFAAVLVEKGAWASVRIGIECGLVSAAGAGLLAAFGWSGLLLVLPLTATSPFVRILLRPARLSAMTWLQ